MPMKLILRADVENLGHLGDVVTVKPGYGRNYLVPQGLAMPATEKNMKVFELERKKLQSKVDALRAEAQTLSEKIAACNLIIKVRVGEADKLYGSVTNANIAEELEAQSIVIDRRKIELDDPIRALGYYTIPVKLHPDVVTELNLRVVRHDWTPAMDEEEAKAAEAAEAEAEAAAVEEAVEAPEAEAEEQATEEA